MQLYNQDLAACCDWGEKSLVAGRSKASIWSRLLLESGLGGYIRIRRGAALSYQHRWWGLLGIAVQSAVSQLVLNADAGADLMQTLLEPVPPLADVLH